MPAAWAQALAVAPYAILPPGLVAKVFRVVFGVSLGVSDGFWSRNGAFKMNR